MADKLTYMPFRPLKSFFPTADELLSQDLPTLGMNLFLHLKSYIGLNTVYQHAGFNKGYFRAMLENRNVGLGSLPKEPEYGARQPEVTRRMMEAWNWLERQGVLIHNDEQVGHWFIISSDAEKLVKHLEADAVTEEYRAARPGANDDRPFEVMAIEEAKKSIAEDNRPHPKVGVVIVKDGRVLAKAHRGENPKSHAEYVALERKLSGETLAGATVYTTLEPCTKRNPPKVCCAQRLAERKVARVFIGMLDPNPDIRGLGDQLLSEAGVDIQLFPRDLRVQVEEMNREFIGDQKQKFKARQPSAEIPVTKHNVVVVEAESNVTFDDSKVSIQKVVEDGGRLRLFVPNEKAKFMFAATVEVRNHATDGKKTAPSGQIKAQLSFRLTQGTYDVAPGAWLDEPYSSVLLDVGDTRRLILAVSENWIQDWRMVTNKRTGPTDAPMLDYSRGFPLLAKGSLEARIVGSGRVLRKLKARVDWKHNENLMLVPMEEG
jgi:pyrimidine deaminase RibD-like protein